MITKANKLRIGSVCSECAGISMDGFKMNISANPPVRKSNMVATLIGKKSNKKSSEVTALF